MSFSGPGAPQQGDTETPTMSLQRFFKREFGRAEPTRLGDLIVFPLALPAAIGLISGFASAAGQHFLDPSIIGYSVLVHIAIQAAILLVTLTAALLVRAKIWTAVLLAIGVYCLLAIPLLVHLALPGVAHIVGWFIGLVAAFQIVRTMHRNRHGRWTGWAIGIPLLAALFSLSFDRAREYSQLNSLPRPPNSPNVLVIVVDTLRADHLSTYGYDRATSPYLTQLAGRGVLFENAISPTSWTLPAHASMLTGLMPNDAHVQTDKDILGGDIPTLGEAMARRGYRTAAFSANYEYFARDHGFGRGFAHFEDYSQSLGGILERVPLSRFLFSALSKHTVGEQFSYFGIKNAPSAETVNADAVHWIAKGRRPFFAVLNYVDVHEPVLPPDRYLHMYTADAGARKISMYFPEWCAWWATEASCYSDRTQIVATYDGAIHYVDDSLRQLLAALRSENQLDNTIVVFTADHGQEFGEHNIFGHGKTLDRPVIHVPLVVLLPGLISTPVCVSTPVSTRDLAATILDLTGSGEKPEGSQQLPGRSLAALWRSGSQAGNWPAAPSELARLHWLDPGAPNYNHPVQSLVTPDWHYIRQEQKDMLFDWKRDADESHNLCGDRPAICSTLEAASASADGNSSGAR